MLPEPKRVVGVIEEFRKDGELSTPENFLFHRLRLDEPRDRPGPIGDLPGVLLIRVAPGTTAAFEETLVKGLQAVAREWSFEVRPLADLREDALRRYLAPLIAVGTVAVFLLLMVALGLTGVVWQSVTQRTREFGLRRAKGASISDVHRQMLIELVIITSIALLAGVILVVQIPLLPLPPDVRIFPAGVFFASIALSAAAIYLLTLLCGWYPSRLATRIQPAEALHYE